MGQGLVIRSLNILLGLFFMFLGSLKITPNIIRDLHKDLRSEYAKYAKVGPLATCTCSIWSHGHLATLASGHLATLATLEPWPPWPLASLAPDHSGPLATLVL